MKHSITIERSTLTGNYLVILDNTVFDSCIKRSDAKKVRDWLIKQLKKNPLNPNQSMGQWLHSCHPQPPKTKAYMLVWKDGKCSKQVICA